MDRLVTTLDHDAATATRHITQQLQRITGWITNVHTLHLAPPIHYTVDRQPGTPTPIEPHVTRPGTGNPTLSRIESAEATIDEICRRIDMARQDLEESCRHRGHQLPAHQPDLPSSAHRLHPMLIRQQSRRTIHAAEWLTAWVDWHWAQAMQQDPGDMRDGYLTRHAVRPATLTLTDTGHDLDRIIRRWIDPPTPNTIPRCRQCGYRPRTYRNPDLCRSCYKQARRQSA